MVRDFKVLEEQQVAPQVVKEVTEAAKAAIAAKGSFSDSDLVLGGVCRIWRNQKIHFWRTSWSREKYFSVSQLKITMRNSGFFNKSTLQTKPDVKEINQPNYKVNTGNVCPTQPGFFPNLLFRTFFSSTNGWGLCVAQPLIFALKDLSPTAVDWSKAHVFFAGERPGISWGFNLRTGGLTSERFIFWTFVWKVDPFYWLTALQVCLFFFFFFNVDPVVFLNFVMVLWTAIL